MRFIKKIFMVIPYVYLTLQCLYIVTRALCSWILSIELPTTAHLIFNGDIVKYININIFCFIYIILLMGIKNDELDEMVKDLKNKKEIL